MRLTVVGNSGSYPGPGSPASCYLLEDEVEGRTWRVLLDLGSGALGALQTYVDPLTVDAVLLSHLHADHCLDLCGFYVMRKYHPSGPQPRLPVWGPAGAAGRMARAYDLDEDPGMNEEYEFRDYPAESFTVGPFSIAAREVYHPVTAYSLRISAAGRTLVYSGDTARCDALTEHAKGADVFLCEASFLTSTNEPDGIHLTGAEAGEVAGEAGVTRLLLTHIPPWYDPQAVLAEAMGTFGGPLELARTGLVYDI
jgi:ribonuclease BN (tRNA processing enzyme)